MALDQAVARHMRFCGEKNKVALVSLDLAGVSAVLVSACGECGLRCAVFGSGSVCGVRVRCGLRCAACGVRMNRLQVAVRHAVCGFGMRCACNKRWR